MGANKKPIGKNASFDSDDVRSMDRYSENGLSVDFAANPFGLNLMGSLPSDVNQIEGHPYQGNPSVEQEVESGGELREGLPCMRCRQFYGPDSFLSTPQTGFQICRACTQAHVLLRVNVVESQHRVPRQDAAAPNAAFRDAAWAELNGHEAAENAHSDDVPPEYRASYDNYIQRMTSAWYEGNIPPSNVQAAAPAPIPAPIPAPVPAPPPAPAPAHMTTTGQAPAQPERVCPRCKKHRAARLFLSRGKTLRICEPCRLQDRKYQARRKDTRKQQRKDRRGGGGPPPSTGSGQQHAVAT